MKRSVAVKVAGHTLNLLTEEDPEYVEQLAAHFAERMDDLRKRSESASAYHIALLAGLHVVDELYQLERVHGATQAQVQERVRRVLRLLDEQELTE